MNLGERKRNADGFLTGQNVGNYEPTTLCAQHAHELGLGHGDHAVVMMHGEPITPCTCTIACIPQGITEDQTCRLTLEPRENRSGPSPHP